MIKVARPVLEGLTDEEMAEKIAQYPQGPHSCLSCSRPWISKKKRAISIKNKIKNRNKINAISVWNGSGLGTFYASWEVTGTAIHVTRTWKPTPSAIAPVSAQYWDIDIKDLLSGDHGWFSIR